MDKVIDLCNKYDIKYYFKDVACHATGIGDILMRFAAIKNGLCELFYINLYFFTKPYYRSDPINQLEFRFKLIKDLCNDNDINPNKISYVFSENYDILKDIPYPFIKNFHLNIKTENNINSEYIIFHTKLRHLKNEHYDLIKKNVGMFCEMYKCRYNIIIMGERKFPSTEESDEHGITTIYDELIKLKNNNHVYDKSIENIYSNLNYENYKHDVMLIKNAKYNICFGLGGQLCTSTVFGKSTLFYCKVDETLNTDYFKKNNFYFKNLNALLSQINSWSKIKEKSTRFSIKLKEKTHVLALN